MARLLIAVCFAFSVVDVGAQAVALPPAPPAQTGKLPAPSAAQTGKLPAPSAAQTGKLPAPTPPTLVPASDYVVGPQDLLNVTVYGEPSLSGRIRVDNDGSFPFQYLGRVKAEGQTTAQIEQALMAGLGDGYLRKPQVSIEVVEYRSQSVFVTGEVRLPNKYSLPGNSTLMDVLTLAGSVTSNAGVWVQITHERVGAKGVGPALSPEYDIRINLRDIQSGKAQNVQVQDGDTIFVPKTERVWVVGQVRNSGGIPFEEGMTVFQAISAAGGVTEKGSNNRVEIIRIENGQRKSYNAKPTDILQPGDQVNVKPRRL